MNKILSLSLIVATFSLSSEAARVKVMRKKGRHAIVQFEGPTPEVGTILMVGDAPNAAPSGPLPVPGQLSRDNLIDLSSGFSKTLGAPGMIMTAAARYGWNSKSMEYGPGVSITKITGAGLGFGLNGFLDFNFTENTVGQTFVPGLGIGANFTKAGGTSFGGDASLFGKFWFLGSSQSALRLEAKFGFAKASGGAGLGKSLGFSAGMNTYF